MYRTVLLSAAGAPEAKPRSLPASNAIKTVGISFPEVTDKLFLRLVSLSLAGMDTDDFFYEDSAVFLLPVIKLIGTVLGPTATEVSVCQAFFYRGMGPLNM